jgi:response regulator RpfG family c-di-GMP phosphodiesterase
LNQPSVFVVDDEEQICTLLQRILTREGYAVQAFHAPEDALAAVRVRAPDLLVTDLMMPGMSGIELIAQARTHAPRMGTIVITGYASIDNVVGALRSGVDDFVTKPFSVAEIRTVAARLLETPARREEPVAEPIAAELGDPVPMAARGAAEDPAEDTAGDSGSRESGDRIERIAEPARLRAAPRSGIGFPSNAESPALARRLSEMSLSERLHGLLAEDLSSATLLNRSAELLRSAFNVSHAALLVPQGREGGFVVLGATAPGASGALNASGIGGRPGNETEIDPGALGLVCASGVPTALDGKSTPELAACLDTGPLAAAPLSPRAPQTVDSGVLVIARASGSPDFDSSELRRLGAAASSLGDVFRAMRTAERAEEAYLDSLTAIVAATENRTPWFARHSERVRRLSLDLGRAVGLAERDLDVLDCAARVLDLGRVEIPDDVLSKPGNPSAAEWRVLRRHVVVADTLLRPIGRLKKVKPVVRHHHENWDGSGYPDGLRGEEIPYLAALVRVTDAYAALTSPRSWRPALPDAEARTKIRELAGRHFHPEIACLFADGVAGEGSAE